MTPKDWGLSKKLAVAALALGGLALWGQPEPGGTVTLDTDELAAIVEGEVDHIEVEQLADWIVQGRSDYRLFDLRDEAAYAAYHIPTAERVGLRQLRGYPVYRNETIVLYADGGIHAAQAWFLLRARGYAGAYILLGGLDLWKDAVLFPSLPPEASDEQRRQFDKQVALSAFFGGAPRTGTQMGAVPEALPPPELEMPAPRVVPRSARKQKEGC